jgi:putative membrane protein
MMVWVKRAGWPIGIAILIALVLSKGAGDVANVIAQAGFALLWLVPFHALPLWLDAYAWHLLLNRRVPLAFLWWVAAVREAVSRLLPAAGIGGEIVGVRLALWRLSDASFVTASVIVEVFVTIAVQYAFSALGLVLIVMSAQKGSGGAIGLALLVSLPLPVLAVMLLRRGGVFHAIERFATRVMGREHRLLQGVDGKRLDAQIDALMRQTGLLIRSFLWQFAGYMSGALETYWALALLGYPVSIGDALAIEALTQAVRHAAFIVPAGLGVQEVAVVMLAQMFGVNHEVALSLALVKRMREVLFGCAALGSWQLAELSRASRYGRAARANELASPSAGVSSVSSDVRDEPQSKSTRL